MALLFFNLIHGLEHEITPLSSSYLLLLVSEFADRLLPVLTVAHHHLSACLSFFFSLFLVLFC